MNIPVLIAIQLLFILCYIELLESYENKIKNCLKNDDNGNCMCCKSGYRGTNCNIYCKQCSSRLVLGTRCSYSCRNGHYGETCNKTCPITCANGVSGDHFCTKTNGKIECDYGCIEGYTGKQCSNCKDNHYYGDHCNIMCSKGCLSETCHRTGHCTLGCIDGFYGGSCNSHCGSNCIQGKCTQDINSTYVCTEGCVDGYMWSNCAKYCPVPCATCEQLNGRCMSCVANYVYMPETGECKIQLASPIWIIMGLITTLGILGVISVVVIFKVKKKCNAKDQKGDFAEEGELSNSLYKQRNKEDDNISFTSCGPTPCYTTEIGTISLIISSLVVMCLAIVCCRKYSINWEKKRTTPSDTEQTDSEMMIQNATRRESNPYAFLAVIDRDCASDHLIQAAMITAPPIIPNSSSEFNPYCEIQWNI